MNSGNFSKTADEAGAQDYAVKNCVNSGNSSKAAINSVENIGVKTEDNNLVTSLETCEDSDKPVNVVEKLSLIDS